eukprot:4469000-Prymnesium_polylepis.1
MPTLSGSNVPLDAAIACEINRAPGREREGALRAGANAPCAALTEAMCTVPRCPHAKTLRGPTLWR